MSVVEAVDRDLERMGGDLADTALAAMARVLAAELDNGGTSATAKSMCAARLQEAMDRLRELAPPRKENDVIDEVGSRRAERRAKAAG
jgi:hypothetical protein